MDIKLFQELTRFKHALFGLPFIAIGVFLGCKDSAIVGWGSLIWILPAFLSLRSAGMTFNQLIDRKIDQKNPRTKNRVLPSRRLSVGHVRLVAWISLFLFVLISVQINRTCLVLTPLAAALVYAYSYMKRFTWACHFVLGLIHCLGPMMAYGAMTNHLSLTIFFIGAGAFFLIASNDIIYALQDLAFDRAHGVFSIPAYFGDKTSRLISCGVQSASLLMFFFVGLLSHFSSVYWLGFCAAAIFLILMQFIKSSERAMFFGNFGVAVSILCGIVGGSI